MSRTILDSGITLGFGWRFQDFFELVTTYKQKALFLICKCPFWSRLRDRQRWHCIATRSTGCGVLDFFDQKSLVTLRHFANESPWLQKHFDPISLPQICYTALEGLYYGLHPSLKPPALAFSSLIAADDGPCSCEHSCQPATSL